MKRYPRNVYVATIASLLTDISSEMVVYLIPLFLANVLNTATAVIGLIEGAAETTASLTKLLSGWISDRIGNRKWPATAGYALSLAAKPLLALAGSWQAVFTARLADRFGKGIRNAPRDALIAASVDPSRRGDAFGFHRAGDTLGAFLGIVALPASFVAGILWQIYGPAAPFLFGAVLAGLAVVLMWRLR